MLKKITFLNYPHLDKIIFILSLMVCGYWYTAQYINVYRFAVVGAFFEMTSIPMLILFLALPIVSILLFIKEKFSLKSFSVYSFLILLTTFLLLNL